jgi:septin family protein
MDKTEAAEPIINYLDQQFEGYLQEELRVARNLSEYADTRVHACLYMLPPTGGVLRKVDLLCLNQLSTKVCLFFVVFFVLNKSKPVVCRSM